MSKNTYFSGIKELLFSSSDMRNLYVSNLPWSAFDLLQIPNVGGWSLKDTSTPIEQLYALVDSLQITMSGR